MNTQLQFPEKPALSALWVPIYMEPIINSGERLTIGIAIITDAGIVDVVSIVEERQARCLFGKGADSFLNIATVTCQSLENYLKRTKSFQQWESPLSGISLGHERSAAGHDIQSIAGTAMRLCASFASGKQLELAAVSQELTEHVGSLMTTVPEDDDRWPTQIRRAVEARQPTLAQNFGREFPIFATGKRHKYDYLGARYAANFGKLRPLSSRLSQDRTTAKSKLWDLAVLRDAPKTLGLQTYELILWRPRETTPDYSATDIERLNEALLRLNEEAKTEELSIFAVFDAEEASQRIIAQDAA